MKTIMRLKIKKVILTVVFFLAAVFVVCGVCTTNKLNAWADSDVDGNVAPFSTVSEEQETVKRLVFSSARELTSTGFSSLYGWRNGMAVGYEGFEYVIGFPLRYVSTQNSFVSLNIGVLSGHVDSSGNFLDEEVIEFRVEERIGYSCLFQLDIGKNYSYQYTPDVCSFDDGLYLTLTHECAIVSYYPADLSTWISEKGEYEDSLSEYMLATFDKFTEEYETILRICLNAYSELWCDFDLGSAYEAVKFYNYEEIPKREGYTFTGWYYDEACTQKCGDGFVDPSVTLYAGYEINKYTVTYYGGLSNDPNEAGLYDRVDKVEHGGIADYVPPTVEGATFMGWYYEDGTLYENTPITQDIALYGHWESPITVTLDLNGGTSESGTTSFVVERGSFFIPPEVVREGYTLVEWRYIDEFGLYGERYVGDFVSSDMQLKAIWERIYYTVEFYVEGVLYESQTIAHGTSLSLNFGTIMEGYTLVGWYLDGQCNNESDCIKYNFLLVHENLSLHGHFEVNKYTVNFCLDGEVIETKIVEYGTEISSLYAWVNDMDLQILSVYAADGGTFSDSIVSCDINVETQKKSGFGKFITDVKNNKWKVIGGVAGGVVLITVIAAVCGGTKRKRKRKR